MGCSGSKSTETSQQNGKPGDKKEGMFLSVSEAEEQVQAELGCSADNAKLLVAKVNRNKDEKIADEELVAMWSAIKQKKDELKPKFAKYDKDNNGTVSKEEALEVLRKKFPGVTAEQLDRMVGRYTEEEGKGMNYNDFIYFYVMVKTRKDHLKVLFVELDKDNSGTLSPEEVVGTVKEECAVDDTMARCLVEDFDINSDGQLNKEEFNNLFIKLFEDQESVEEQVAEE